MSGTTVINYGNDIYAFDQGMARAFLICGKERALLFDTGVEKTCLMEGIRELTELPVQLCLSHSDPDHRANISEFDSLYLHKDEVRRLKESCDTTQMILIPIEEVFVFDLGNRRLRVIHCPGHTPGSIALLEEEERILFSGDTVSYGPVYMFGEGREDAAYMDSLKRLDELSGKGAFDRIYPCHNTCPIGIGPIRELLSCMEGIQRGELSGTATPMKDHKGRRVLEYREGSSGIYHI